MALALIRFLRLVEHHVLKALGAFQVRHVQSARAVKVLLHLLRRVGAREVFTQPVAGDGDAVYLRLFPRT